MPEYRPVLGKNLEAYLVQVTQAIVDLNVGELFAWASECIIAIIRRLELSVG